MLYTSASVLYNGQPMMREGSEQTVQCLRSCTDGCLSSLFLSYSCVCASSHTLISSLMSSPLMCSWSLTCCRKKYSESLRSASLISNTSLQERLENSKVLFGCLYKSFEQKYFQTFDFSKSEIVIHPFQEILCNIIVIAFPCQFFSDRWCPHL